MTGFDCAFPDLKKVLNMEPHRKLLELEIIGWMQGKLLDWMKEQSNNQTRVSLEKKLLIESLKDWCWLRLYLPYVNDIDNSVDSCFFGSDYKLLRKVSEKNDCETLQQDHEDFGNGLKNGK